MRGRVPYKVFLQEVLPYVPDCPELVAISAIRDACIEFCEKSHFLRAKLECDDIEAGEAEYPLPRCEGYDIIMVLAAWYKGRTLHVTTIDQLNARYGTDWRGYRGAPVYFVQDRPDTIIFSPTPDKSEEKAWFVEVALKPTRDSTGVDMRVYERFADVIGYGARAKIHEIPNQPYSDPQAAIRFRTWFDSGCTNARIMTNKGVGRAGHRVRPRMFGV